jgi:hypothetical protein
MVKPKQLPKPKTLRSRGDESAAEIPPCCPPIRGPFPGPALCSGYSARHPRTFQLTLRPTDSQAERAGKSERRAIAFRADASGVTGIWRHGAGFREREGCGGVVRLSGRMLLVLVSYLSAFAIYLFPSSIGLCHRHLSASAVLHCRFTDLAKSCPPTCPDTRTTGCKSKTPRTTSISNSTTIDQCSAPKARRRLVPRASKRQRV